MLKPFLLICAAALFSIAPSIVSAAPPQDAAAKVPAKVTPDSQAKAKKIYARDLAKDMQLTMVDWSDPKTLADRQDQELFKIIRNGKDKMPAEDPGRAKDDEVWNLVVYIRALGKAQPVAPATPAAASTAPAPGN